MKFIQAMIALLVSSLLGGWLGFHGASWAGMKSSSGADGGFESFGYLSLGLVTALITFPLAMVALRQRAFRSRLAESLITSVSLAFLSGFVIYRLNDRYDPAEVNEGMQAARQRYVEYYAALRTNPGIVVQEKWYRDEMPQQDAYHDSLKDPAVAYTPEILSKIYQSDIDGHEKIRILEHPACDLLLMESEFHRLFEEQSHYVDDNLLEALLKHPRAKDAWFERLAGSSRPEHSSGVIGNLVDQWRKRRGTE